MTNFAWNLDLLEYYGTLFFIRGEENTLQITRRFGKRFLWMPELFMLSL